MQHELLDFHFYLLHLFGSLPRDTRISPSKNMSFFTILDLLENLRAGKIGYLLMS